MKTFADDLITPIFRHEPYEGGLTKREYFAGVIMQGLLSKYSLNNPTDQGTVAKLSVELADTLINTLNS